MPKPRRVELVMASFRGATLFQSGGSTAQQMTDKKILEQSLTKGADDLIIPLPVSLKNAGWCSRNYFHLPG